MGKKTRGIFLRKTEMRSRLDGKCQRKERSQEDAGILLALEGSGGTFVPL